MVIDLEAKAREINLVLSEPDVDLWRLRELALTEGGLVDDTLRRRAWPKLVGLHHDEDNNVEDDVGGGVETRSHQTSHKQQQTTSTTTIPCCLDADQIDRDVARCTWHLLTGSQRSRRLQMENKHKRKMATLLKKKQTRLSNLINITLCSQEQNSRNDDNDDSSLRYYQGYHDVACIFLHALGGGGSGPLFNSTTTTTTSSNTTGGLSALADGMGLLLPSQVLLQISRSHLRDAMRSNFHQLQTALRLTLFPLISKLDPQVHNHLYDCAMEPFFALSWVITWFAHDVRDTAVVKRLFDALIVSHPLFVIYMSVAMVLHPFNRQQVLQADRHDFASVHQALVSLPKNSSMVGWSFVAKDVVCDQDGNDDDDDETVGSSADIGSVLSMEDDGASTSGSTSVLSGMSSLNESNSSPRVPFQEIIDSALSYMRRIPPRKLLSLAKRYFGDEAIQPMLEQCSSISLLQPPPSWGLLSTTPADWVLKQRARESRGLKATNRRDRRNRSKTTAEAAALDKKKPSDDDDDDHKQLDRYLEEKKKTLAVIASGVGRADDEEEERRKKRRKLMLYSGIALGLVALSCVVVVQYRPTVSANSSDGGFGLQSDSKSSKRDPAAASKEIKQAAKQTTAKRTETTARDKTSTRRSPSETQNRSAGRAHERSSTPPRVEKATKVETTKQATKASSVSSHRTNKSATARTTAITDEKGGTLNGLEKLKILRRQAENVLVQTTSRLGQGIRFARRNVLVPGTRRLQHFLLDLRTVISGRDIRKLPGFDSLYNVTNGFRLAAKERDASKIPGSKAVQSLAETARASLAENDCEIVAI